MIPLLIAGVSGVALLWSRSHKTTLPPEHAAVFNKAVTGQYPAAKLAVVSQAFAKAGYPQHAQVLQNKAAVQKRSPQDLLRYSSIASRALQSRNPTALSHLAVAYAGQGMMNTALSLQARANKVNGVVGDVRNTAKNVQNIMGKVNVQVSGVTQAVKSVGNFFSNLF